jgi:hypothetical protein
LVVGIRLFNKEIGKGGSGLLGLGDLLNVDALSVKEESFKEVEDVTEQCEKYSHIFKVYQKGKIDLQPS